MSETMMNIRFTHCYCRQKTKE